MKKLFVSMLTVKHTFKLYDICKRHFHNEEDFKLFVSEMEEVINNRVDIKMNDFATKSDFADLRSDFVRFESSVNLNLVNSALILEKSQKEQLKWLIGAMVAIIGIAVTIIKLF